MDNTQIKQEVEEITIDDVINLEQKVVYPKYEKITEECEISRKNYTDSRSKLKLQNGTDTTALNLLGFAEKAERGKGKESQFQTGILQNKRIGNISTNRKGQRWRPIRPKPIFQHNTVTVENQNNNSQCNTLKPVEFQPSKTKGQHNIYPRHFNASNIRKPKLNLFNNCNSSDFLSDCYRGWPKGDMVSQLNNMFSENNQHSSDEDEDAINDQVNKMRERNGLPPIDCKRSRKSRSESKKSENSHYEYVLINSPVQVCNLEVDSESNYTGGSSRSSPDRLFIDESATDTTDTNSISSPTVQPNSIYSVQLQAKRARKEFEDTISKASTGSYNNETGLKVMRMVGSRNFVVVDTANRSDSRTNPISKKSDTSIPKLLDLNQTDNSESERYAKDNVKNSGINKIEANNKNVALQKILSAIRNLKQESEDSIKREQNSSDNPRESIADAKSSSANANSGDPERKSNVFQCIPCNLRFDEHLDLKKHILSVHIKIYQCSSCPFRTLIPLVYQKHLLMHISSKSSESSDSGSPLQIKQLSSSGSSKSSASSRTSSPIEIIEIDKFIY